jgi:hypothetical protein
LKYRPISCLGRLGEKAWVELFQKNHFWPMLARNSVFLWRTHELPIVSMGKKKQKNCCCFYQASDFEELVCPWQTLGFIYLVIPL